MPRQAIAIIPARLDATRFPRKLLARWRGKTVLEWVWRATVRCPDLADVRIATGDHEIQSMATQFGANVHYDTAPYLNGTERSAGVSTDETCDVVVVQADQPGLQTEHLSRMLSALHTSRADMVTPCVPLPKDARNNPDVVKCWSVGPKHNAFFSRHPPKEPLAPTLYRHIGLYAYRAQALREYAHAAPVPEELSERLEQLRCLALGQRVQLITLSSAAPCVDRPDDIDKLSAWFSRR